MSENEPEQAPAAPQQQVKVLGQFIRDLSFENFLLQRGQRDHKPAEFQVNINLDGKQFKDGTHESIVRLQVTSNEKGTDRSIYYLELEFSGLFKFEGIPEEHFNQLLMVECPRVLFPFLRRIVHDVTRDGGFPPFNLEMIDFARMYQAALQKQAKAGNGKP